MSLELENIILTIDSREKNEKRIKAVESWGELHGAIIEHSKLDLCDYRIMGEFRGVPVNLGIEAKGLSDFCSCDYEDLKQKLFNSYELYDNVALFIEVGNYSFLNEGFGKSIIINPAVRDGSADVCNLAVLEGCCSTLSQYGIHVRQLRSEAQFPYSIGNLLTYCIRDHSITRNGEMSKWEYILTYRNALSGIKGINTKKRLDKIMKAYPNFHFLASASEESLIQVMGKQVGMTIYAMLRYQGLMTDEWRNGHFPDGTHKILLPPDEILDKIKQAIIDYLTMIYPHALSVDEICDHFNIEQGDEDKESFLVYLKELAWDKQITNTSSGLFQICNDKTDKSGFISRTPQQELEVIHQAPVLSESQHYSHPGAILTPQNKPGDAQGVVLIQRPVVQGKDLKKVASFDPKPSLAITHDKELDVFGKDNPDWEPAEGNKMNLRARIEAYLNKPHTLQECVDTFDMFQNGTVWEHIMRMKKEGLVVEFDNKTLIMTR